ncbi:MAG TPA: hypothetical protein VFY33_05755 [Solirubrobacterales bacterium]|nr:hypothetical protein [Solirubrobacterales bacterium]
MPEGRYLVREGETERVLIVQVPGAQRAERRIRRRGKRVEPGEPESVPVTRLTVTGERVADAAEGDAWLDQVLQSTERAPAEVRSATRVANRALSALRAGAGDPLVQEIGASRALAIRIGHGTGDELAEGRWTAARELSHRRPRRLDDVDPQSRVAAVLAGRDEVHPAETLMLRARLDAEQGRDAEARYGLRAARTALEERPSEREAKLRKQLDALEAKLRAD